MVINLKGIYKLANHIEDFLKNLDSDSEFATIRDTLNLSLLNLQRYYKSLTCQLENFSSTKFVIVDKYSWKWMDLPNKKFSAELPLLLEAIKSGNTSDVRVHLGKNVLNKCDSIGRNALLYIVHYFSESTFNDFKDLEINFNTTNCGGQNALHLACKEGNLFAIKALLLRGADVYLSDEFGRTAMHWSVVAPDTSCLEYLLECGYDASKCSDYEGMTPAMWAAHLNKMDHLRLLLRRPLSKNRGINDDAGEDDDIVEDGNERDQYGRSWIHWCVQSNGDHLCLKEYLSKEALKLKDNLGRSLVHIAAEKGSVDAMKIICSVGGGDVIEERDSLDRTPLIIASMGGHGELINHLLSIRADLLKVDGFGASAWDYARSNQLHYCMLIIASHLRQSPSQPAFDLSSSINFNQSLRLSLTHSRSTDIHQGDSQHVKLLNHQNDAPKNLSPPECPQQLHPHPPKTPSISPLRNFRRHKTPSPNKNKNLISSKSSEDRINSGNAQGSNGPTKDKFSKTRRAPRKYMVRQVVITGMGSSSDDDNEHTHQLHAVRKNSNMKQSENLPERLRELQNRIPQDFIEYGTDNGLSLNPENSDSSSLSHEKFQKRPQNSSLQPKKVNFNVKNKTINLSVDGSEINVSNLVAKENFAKWDLDVSNHGKTKQCTNEVPNNPWIGNSISTDLHTIPRELDAKERNLEVQHPSLGSENLPRKSERTSTRSVNNAVDLKKIPMPAPRRLSRIDGTQTSQRSSSDCPGQNLMLLIYSDPWPCSIGSQSPSCDWQA